MVMFVMRVEKLNQFQSKETTNIPEDIYDKIHFEIKKRKYERYDKTTDFGNWVWRSKHGNNSRARKELKVEDYNNIMRTHCPLLEMELSYKSYEGKVCPSNYATLDKIDPSKGYVCGNIQILSYRANTLKNSATIDELKTIIKNWENLLE